MRIVFNDGDNLRTKFEAAVYRVGQKDAKRVFQMALNKVGRKTFTKVKADISAISSLKKSDVAHVATLAAKACGWLPELLRHPDYRIDGAKPRLVGKMAAAEQTDDRDAAEVAAPPKRARRAG